MSTILDEFRGKAYPYQYAVTLNMASLAGATPANERVAEAWMKSVMGADQDAEINRRVAEMMVDRGLDRDAAAAEVLRQKSLVGFKRDNAAGGLYFEGRCIASALREWGSIAVNEGKIPNRWGGDEADRNYRKGWKGWSVEHLFVQEDRIFLGRTEPDGIYQSFPKSMHGSSIQYTEYVEDCDLSFTIITDHDWKTEHLAAIMYTGEQNGTGGNRRMGFGKFTVTQFDALHEAPKKARARTLKSA